MERAGEIVRRRRRHLQIKQASLHQSQKSSLFRFHGSAQSPAFISDI